MIKTSYLLVACISIIALAPSVPAVARAQTAEAQTQAREVCDLGPQVRELTATRYNSSLSYLEKLWAETEARRNLLIAVISCDREEITQLRKIMDSLPAEIKSLPAHDRILNRLAVASSYYDQQGIGIQEMKLQDIRSTSRSLGTWRSDNYAPLVAWADNFILWSGNQEFINRAAARLSQVNRLVFSLKLVNQDEAVAAKIEEARKKFEEASTENTKAREALNQGEAAHGLERTQASLKALAETYNILLELQESL